jgi:hypothetical protein
MYAILLICWGMQMPEWLKYAWNDSVWSKVIAGLIVAVIVASLKTPRGWILRLLAPKLANVHAWASEQPGATYPLKYYVEMRNDSRRMMDVRLLTFSPNTVTLKRFIVDSLQLRLRDEWVPTKHSVERIAVLPGQSCRAWLGVDESKFSKTQLDSLTGKIGKLTVKVNWRSKSFDL